MAGSQVPAVVNAAVDALKTDTTLSGLLGGAKVYTNVPQGTDVPWVQVLGGDEIPWATTFGDDDGSRQVDLLATCVTTYKGTQQVDGIASAVMSVLLENAPWLGIDEYEEVELVRNTAQPPVDLLADGVLWFLRTVVVRVSLR